MLHLTSSTVLHFTNAHAASCQLNSPTYTSPFPTSAAPSPKASSALTPPLPSAHRDAWGARAEPIFRLHLPGASLRGCAKRVDPMNPSILLILLHTSIKAVPTLHREMCSFQMTTTQRPKPPSVTASSYYSFPHAFPNLFPNGVRNHSAHHRHW